MSQKTHAVITCAMGIRHRQEHAAFGRAGSTGNHRFA